MDLSQSGDQIDEHFSELVTDSVNDIIDGITAPCEKRFFHHFVTVTTAIFTLPSGMTRPQLVDLIIRNIQQDKMILTTVLCLGASHLINQSSSHVPRSKLQDIVCVKDRLWKKANDEWISWLHPPEISINSSVEEVRQCELLILNNLLQYFVCISEGLINESSLIHLDHAREILVGLLPWLDVTNPIPCETNQETVPQDALQETRPISLDRCLVNLFIYHDVLASVTAPREPTHSPGISLSCPIYGRINAIGMPNQVIPLILRIKDIESQAAGASVLPPMAISEAVRVWQDVDKSITSQAPCSPVSEERLSLESHLIAASIWLYSIIYPDGIADDKAQEMVQRGLRGLESLSTTEKQSCSLFPFFVIGISCIRSEDREVLSGLFDRLDRVRHLRYTRVCIRFIREMWQLFDNGSKRSWKWSEVMKGRAMELLVT